MNQKIKNKIKYFLSVAFLYLIMSMKNGQLELNWFVWDDTDKLAFFLIVYYFLDYE